MPPPLDLVPEKILILEFKYASETAAQSSNDRTAVVNLYLLLVGGVGTFASTALSSSDSSSSSFKLSPRVLAIVFLALALVGYSFVFKLIRLRQAWYESTKAMNAVKDFYLMRYPELGGALRWQSGTIPEAGKPWSITFNLTLLIVILDSSSLAAAVYFARAAADANRLYYMPEVLAAMLFAYFQERFYTFHMPCKCAQGCENGETACKERILFSLWGKREVNYADGFFSFLFDPTKRHVVTSGGIPAPPSTPRFSADVAPPKAAPKRSTRSASVAKSTGSGSAQFAL